jgi:16S rRNA (guanine966-N2)-methyltransferase
MSGLRIIAGDLKGRRITVPASSELRPTPERVREALFSILGESVVGARVLDAYSGSGALAFEALSRGAQHLILIERDSLAVRALRESADTLGVSERIRILHGQVRDLMQGDIINDLDLVLADPPYGGEEAGLFLQHIARVRALAGGGRLVLERPRKAEPVTQEGLDLSRSARYGNTRLDFYKIAN